MPLSSWTLNSFVIPAGVQLNLSHLGQSLPKSPLMKRDAPMHVPWMAGASTIAEFETGFLLLILVFCLSVCASMAHTLGPVNGQPTDGNSAN